MRILTFAPQFGMAKLIFRCVQTGMNVQVWLPEAAATEGAGARSGHL